MKNKQIDKKENKKNQRKKKKIWWKIILLVIILAIIAGGASFAYRTYKNGGGLSGMLAAAVGHDENTRKNLEEIKVLLLGVSTDLDSELTDTIIVASYNPNTQKANLLSIPRDTYTGKNANKATAAQKINALYNLTKNPQKTLDAVNELTGLDIKYYVLVRTEALIKLVDAIGGVQFNVPIDMYYTDKTQNLVINLKSGMQEIDGNKAEQLLRFRHNNNGTTYPSEYGSEDLGRMRTQREFIVETLKQTLKPSNIFKIGEILDIASQNVETNLSFSYVKDYVPYAVELNAENVETAALPGEVPNLNETNGVSIFVANKKETQQLIQDMFYTNTTETEQENNTTANNITNNISSSTNKTSKIKIELLNGSGDKNNLQKAQQMLEQMGYEVTKKGNTTAISKTIITNKKDISSDELKELKETLGVGTISTSKSSTSLVDVSIIIGKDFQ